VKRRLAAMLIAATIGALAGSLTIAATGPATALASCNPGRSNNGAFYSTGRGLNVGARTGGIYSNILNYSPYVYTGKQTQAWAILSDASNHVYDVGWLQMSSGTRYTVVQWTDTSGVAHQKTFSPQPVGAYTYYTVLYDNPTGHMSFQVNNSTIDTENNQFMPTVGLVEGAINTLASQMPGGVYGGEVFADSHIYVYGWAALGGTDFNSSSSYFGIADVSSLQTNIWDKSCSS
jgi:hypothetical protein